jgi:DNA-binding transcriptional regulator PaaX
MGSPDSEILRRIQGLVEEEHQLRNGEAVDARRLRHLEEELDQCWDLLRQRRARREFAQDPSAASPRSPNTVEHYQQ